MTAVAFGVATAVMTLVGLRLSSAVSRLVPIRGDLLCGVSLLIVAIVQRTGLFEFLAIWATKRARGRPFRVMVILILVTALASAVLDNVTTVLLVLAALLADLLHALSGQRVRAGLGASRSARRPRFGSP